MTLSANASAAQERASRPDKSSWVSANAGSGKTRVLTSRVARLLLRGVDPQLILCLTYTKAAASVMQNRLFELLGSWSMLPTDKLREGLAELGESRDSLIDESLRNARTLFAAALETPGGLKIQTIHSFCDSVLRKFPLEAGVSPSFSTLETKQKRSIFQDILREMAQSDIGTAFGAMASNMSNATDSVGNLVEAIIAKRACFAVKRDESHFRKVLSLPATANLQDLQDGLMTPDTIGLLCQMRDALPLDADSDTRTRRAIERILLDPNADTVLKELEDRFLYGNGTKNPFAAKIDRWATDLVRKANPHLTEPANELARQIETNRPIRLALRTLSSSIAIQDFAVDFLRRYDDKKSANGYLDYDDQIQLARKLLTDTEVSNWVLSKLDGRISHILVDEAQDTSPAQWDIIKAISDDFFDGLGGNSGPRSIFAVGDSKQSIFSFQGADPSAFGKAKLHYLHALDDIADALEDCELLYSFRSAPPILQLVDKVMAASSHAASEGKVQHLSPTPEKAGRIELWDRLEKSEPSQIPPWWVPDPAAGDDSHVTVLAEKIADWVQSQLAEGVLPIKDGPRAITPGDILILVKSRNPIFHAILNALKSRNLPVAGADRFKLSEELAVKDLLAALTFTSSPFDDLSLASALRSPLCGLNETELFELAFERNEQTLWERLLSRRESYRKTVAMFEALRSAEGYSRPYELLEIILTKFDGRQNLLGRLGMDSAEGIDELLSQALAYESIEAPTLEGFLHWISMDDATIVRQQEHRSSSIRVMTIHGAKGLESPIVILPQTGPKVRKGFGGGLSELEDGTILSAALSDDAPEAFERALNLEHARQDAEEQRLFYVAMTRAEHWLIVCESRPKGRNESETWYSQIDSAMPQLGAIRSSNGLVLESNWHADMARTPTVLPLAPEIGLPVWASERTAPIDRRPRILNPSQLGGSHVLPGDSPSLDDDRNKVAGSLIHLLLEYLPSIAAPHRAVAASEIIASHAPIDFEGRSVAIEQEVLALIAARHLEHIFFAPNAQSEVQLAANLAGQPVLGRIDRLIIGENKITAIDYKSNAIVASDVANVPEGILRQMGAYRAALAEIWPGRGIETAILWTKTAQLMVLPQNIVMDAFARRDKP